MSPSTSSYIHAFTLWQRFLFALVLTGLVLGGIITVIYRQDVQHQRELLAQEGQHVLHLQQELLLSEIRAVQSDLLYLSTQNELKHFLSGDNTAKSTLEDEYVSFALNKAVYDQIRILDTSGQELVRINYVAGQATVVPEEDLQSKATRYYYRQALSLDKGELFVSPFDLNVEYGKIQHPIRPVIRFLTPIFDETGTARGLLVLNYVGGRLISKLKQIARGFRGEAMLINPAGEYLLAPNPQHEWGWLLGHEHRFRDDFPQAWERGRELISGQFRLRDNLFTFQRVAPARRLVSNVSTVSSGRDELQPSSLILASVVSAEVEKAHSRTLLNQLLVMYAGVMVVVSVLSYFWARSREIRIRHENQIAESEARLRKLSSLLLDAQEAERRTLSRDLHDELGQLVTAIHLDLRSLAKAQNMSRQPDLLERAIAETDQLLKSLHEIAIRVRPSVLDDLGLLDAVQSHLADYQQRTGIQVSAQLDLEGPSIPARVCENLYRILQEALANVTTHAQTKAVEVTMEVHEGALQLTIEDHGVGFEPATLVNSSRLGVLGMRERAELLNGHFELASQPGEGTRIRVTFPLDDER